MDSKNNLKPKPESKPNSPAIVYLASQSPRRSEILTQMGVAHKVLLPTDAQAAEALEDVLDCESPLAYVQRVALLKLQQALRQHQPHSGKMLLLCADTTVALGDLILGKPADAEEAFSMLQSLSGHTHTVYTAVAVAYQDKVYTELSTSVVEFALMPEQAIAAYIATGEPFGKAGAYALQGQGANWVRRIEGSESGIRGLPIFETASLLRRLGFVFSGV